MGRNAPAAMLGWGPTARELGGAFAARLDHMPAAVTGSGRDSVLPGVRDLLPRLVEAGHPVGLTTGGTEAAARIKLARGGLNRFFADRRHPLDVPAAHGAGAIAVAVAVAVASRELDADTLHRAGADHVPSSRRSPR